MTGIVAIVGRPNVGKSTLFNRLIESRLAIVFDEPGVTRDRNTGVCEWNGREFTVIDTGGYIPLSGDVFAAAVREQVEIALEDAQVVIFVVDVKEGLTPGDEEILDVIRRRKKDQAHVLLAVNKVDNPGRDFLASEFYALGFNEIFNFSALSGAGTGELLDAVVKALPDDVRPDYEPGVPRIAVVGRPNVGKSSFVNALLGRNERIVTPIAGTTRDATATRYTQFGMDFYLVDTAGLRKKARVEENVEYFSTIRTIKAIQEADITLLMIDAQTKLEAQDLAILHLIEKHRKALILLVNKWDLVAKSGTTDREFRAHIEERIAPLSGVPVVFISATEKTRVLKAMQTAQEVYKDRNRRIPTRELNDTLIPIFEQTSPPSQRGKLIRIKFVTQVEGRVPTFVFFCNYPKLVRENYKRFIEGQIRKLYGFDGWPISLYFREKG